MTRKTLFFLTLLLSLSASAQYREDIVKLKEGDLHFYTKGEGRPVVLLQGGPGFSSYYMRAIADSLKGYKCILIDYEGTGKSQGRKPDTTWVSPEKVVADIEAVRKKLNIPTWDVIGHSYGTHFGLYYAIHYPQRVGKIILVSSIGTNNAFQQYANDNAMARLTDSDMQQLGALDADTAMDPVEKEFKLERILLRSYFFDRKKVEPFVDAVPAEEKPRNFNTLFFNAYWEHPNFMTWDISEKAYRLENPIRIIQGRQDFLNDGQQEIMNLRLRNSKIYYIERSGHFPWAEQPVAFFALLRRELAE